MTILKGKKPREREGIHYNIRGLKRILQHDVMFTMSRVLCSNHKPTPFLIEVKVYLYPPELSLWVQILWIYIVV